MTETNHLLIGTHGNFGEELTKSASMIVGELHNIHCFSLLPGMSVEEYMGQIMQVLQDLPEGTLCLVDLFGGTPSNTFAALSRKYHNVVVSGLNLAMFLEVYMNLQTKTTDDLVKLALTTLKESGKDVIKTIQNG